MLGPLELPLMPSCVDCLSWSTDGELALAAGESVHILTPKISGDISNRDDPDRNRGRDQWNKAKFTANVFRQEDWPPTLPRDPQKFSIGAEQSLSPVIALQWSPPGLARHRRCLLAVLTANLILSIWEPLGHQNKWTRVLIVNQVVQKYFGSPVEDAELRHRKQLVRSFCWSPACNISAADNEPVEMGGDTPSHRNWGCIFLAVANGNGAVVFLRLEKIKHDETIPRQLVAKALAHADFGVSTTQYPAVQTGSLLAASLNAGGWISHISWGPWVYATLGDGRNPQAAHSVIAVIQKSTVRLTTLSASHEESGNKTLIDGQRYTLLCHEGKHTLQHPELEGSKITGPLLWTEKEGSKAVGLLIGALGAIITVDFLNGGYGVVDFDSFVADLGAIAVSRASLLENTSFMGPENEEDRALSWDPIVAMTSTIENSTRTSIVHSATVFSQARSCRMRMPGEKGSDGRSAQTYGKTPYWYSQVAEFRDRFDLDHDLGGYAVARVWGLGAHRGWITVCFTLHPSDMVEYITMSEERSIIVFSPVEQPGESDSPVSLPWDTPNPSPDWITASRQRVLRFTLGLDHAKYFRTSWQWKILYAAACSSVVTTLDTELLALSKSALEYLANVSGADLGEEISKCVAAPTIPDDDGSSVEISAKSTQQLQGAGSELFESCEICGSGIGWFSELESQCCSGHNFVRCGLTFLSIQGPDGSKFCSLCGEEYLEEESILETLPHSKDGGYVNHVIFDTFDTCVSCGGKFHS